MSERKIPGEVWDLLKSIAVQHRLTLDINVEDGSAILSPIGACANLDCQIRGGEFRGDTGMVTTRHVRWFHGPECIHEGQEAHYRELQREVLKRPRDYEL